MIFLHRFSFIKRKCGHWSKLSGCSRFWGRCSDLKNMARCSWKWSWLDSNSHMILWHIMCVRMNSICDFLTNIWCMTFVWNFHRFILLRVLEKLRQMIIQGVIQEKLITRETMELILYQVVSLLKRVFQMLLQRKNW